MRSWHLLLRRNFLAAVILASFPFSTSADEPKGPLAGFAVSRDWSDASGKFKIRAKLKFADQTRVELLKEDGKSIEVPLAKLSEVDKGFVEGFLQAEKALGGAGGDSEEMEDDENPFAGGEPADASNRPSKGRAGSSAGSPSASAIPKRPVNAKSIRQLTITPSKEFWSASAPLGFPDVSFEDLILPTPLPKPFFAGLRALAAGKSGNLVLNTYQEGRGNNENFSKFVVVAAATGDASPILDLPQPWKLMAISPDGTKAAAVRIEGFDKGNDVAIFSVGPEGLEPEFQFTGGGGSWDELHFVAFLNAKQLVTISQKSNLTFWDLEGKPGPKAERRGNSGGAMSAELSPAGELMAMVQGPSVAFLDTSSGKLVGTIRRDQPISKISMSSDGQSLAVFHPFQVAIYSLQDGKEIKQFAVSDGNAQAELRWAGKHLMVGNIAYDVERGVPLWTYECNPSARAVLGNYLISVFGGEPESTATIFRIPHEEAVRAGADVDPSAIYAIVPGDAISVQYQLGNVPPDKQQAVRQAVETKIKDLGWRVSESAPNSMVVKIETGKPEEAEYFTYNGFGPGPIFAPPGFGRTSGPGIKVQCTPWIHSVVIHAGGQQVFQSQYHRGAPHNLETKDGQSTQQAVNEYCQPFPNFFQTAAIPPHLLKAEYQGGLGKSKIDATGLH